MNWECIGDSWVVDILVGLFLLLQVMWFWSLREESACMELREEDAIRWTREQWEKTSARISQELQEKRDREKAWRDEAQAISDNNRHALAELIHKHKAGQ